MLNTWQISISTFSDAHWIMKFSVQHKNIKKASPWERIHENFQVGVVRRHIQTINKKLSCDLLYKFEVILTLWRKDKSFCAGDLQVSRSNQFLLKILNSSAMTGVYHLTRNVVFWIKKKTWPSHISISSNHPIALNKKLWIRKRFINFCSWKQ